MGWYNNTGLKLLPKCLDYCLVKSYPTLKNNRRFDFLPQPDIIDIVAHQSLAQAIENILNMVSHLLFVYHIRFAENSAPSCNAYRSLAGQSPPGELLDVNPKAQCLVIKEATGAGGTHGIHGEIGDNAVPNNNYLTVLAADFQNCLYRGDVM